MSTQKLAPRLGLVALALSLALATAVGASPIAEPQASMAVPATVPVAPIISYQGQLTDAAGNPLSGSYNLSFQIWDDATTGSPVGPDIVRPGVAVEEGLFTLELDVPPVALDGRALWLRIGVNGEWLTPRQALLGVPYALTLRPGAVIDGDGPDPFRTLKVINRGLGAALGAEGVSVGIHAVGMTGIKAEGDLGIMGSGMQGVRGMGNPGTGVEGISEGGTGVEGVGNGDGAKGVVGTADGYTSTGVEGNAQFGIGVLGRGEVGVKAEGTVSFGVQAEGAMGVQATGLAGDGLSAETAGDDPAAAVRGTAATDAFGGHFTSAQGIGVWGIGVEGVHGQATDADSPGVHGTGPGVGVRGNSVDATGVLGESNHGFGMAGVSTNGVGVSGSAGTVPLVLIQNKIGVLAQGEDQGINAWGGQTGGQFGGTVGISATGDGASGEGVHGHGSGKLAEGVLGTSAEAAGVYGIAGGTSANAIGVWGQTAGTYGLYTAQKVYAGGGCVGCAFVQLARNAGDDTLQVGDVVTIVGIAPPLRGHPTPRLSVRLATAGDTGLQGVVQSRVTITTRPVSSSVDPDRTVDEDIPATAPGAAAPGAGLLVVLEGLAQVRVENEAGPVRVGDALTLGAADGVSVSSPDSGDGSPLGYALEPLPTGSGLIWALLTAR